MKKSTCILLFLALISLGSVRAQTGLRFGFKAGYSMALQYGISPADDTYTVETGNRNGFAGGVFLYIPINGSAGLQQELMYAQKGSKQDFFFDVRMTVGWNTLQMPNAKGADPVPLRNQDYVFALGIYF